MAALPKSGQIHRISVDTRRTREHDQVLTNVKKCLTTSVLAYFDVIKATRVCTDTSRQGLVFVMQQQVEEGEWHLVQAASCWPTNTLQLQCQDLHLLNWNYAFAVTWAI